nr:M56 family metallopeptidase [uncultured Allomuricauda sp.]
MEALLIHLLKSSGIILLFLGCYYIFLRKETFFKGNRWFLFFGLLISLTIPFITITKTVMIGALSISEVQAAQPISSGNQQYNNSLSNLWLIVSVIYLMGVIYMGIRLAVQFYSIKRLLSSSKLLKDYPFCHVQTEQSISPFSFFRYIFYNKQDFDRRELESVIAHEKVHARENHSLDILLMELSLIILWFNPVIWFYRNSLKQNLEFLADAQCCGKGEEKKTYQYLMLKQTIGAHNLFIANPFYNSLIKKRIVMLNQNQSKKTNMLKMCFVLPAIALFLVSFNTKTEFVHHNDQFNGTEKLDEKAIKLTIDKDTSDEELLKIKTKLEKDGIDFSYTVVHNGNNEIIDVSLQLSGINSDGETFSGNYNSSSDGPIKPILIYYNDATNTISFGNTQYNSISIHSDNNNGVWINSGNKNHQNITIVEKDGQKKIMLNGKEISEDELKDMNINIHDDHQNDDVQIHVDSDNAVDIDKHISRDEHVHEEVNIMKETEVHNDSDAIPGSNGLLFRSSDSNEKPIYYVDGKKAKEKDVEKLSPDDIETITVLKGNGAIKKYGKKAKNGVVEIITKEEK